MLMKKFFGSIFSKDKVNTGRQNEIDLIKGFTLILLVFAHVLLFLLPDTNSILYTFTDIAASEPGAPIFMIAMGISIVFSKNHDAKSFFKRGIMLLIAAFVLNLLRSFPYFFMKNVDYFASIPGFFVDDIYQLAGLSFLLFGVFKLLKIPNWGVLLISIGFLIVGQILMTNPNALNFNEIESCFLNFFLPLDNVWCCFNLLTWFIYPCFGLVFGEALVHCKNKDKFYLILLIVGAIGGVLLYTNLLSRFPDYTSYYTGNNFYRMGIINTLLTLLFDCFLISVWYFIGKIVPKFINKFLSFLSNNIAIYYILTWIFIAPFIHIQAEYNVEFSALAIIGIMLFVYLSSFLCILYPYKKLKELLSKKKKHSIYITESTIKKEE